MIIAIVGYGMGNPGSILNMLKSLDIQAVISSDPEVIHNATKTILPGVGAFDNGVMNLRAKGFDLLSEKVLVQKTPIPVICLGMQLMTLQSEEGKLEGLGWIKAMTIRFISESTHTLKVPHIG